MIKSVFGFLPRAGQGENCAPVLNGSDAPCTKTAPVPNTIDLVQDRSSPVAGAQKIAVQRMQTLVAVHGAKCRCQSLGQDLTTKYVFGIVVLAAKQVLVDGLNIE